MRIIVPLITFFAGLILASVAAYVLYFAPLGSVGTIDLPEYEPGEHATRYTPPEQRNAAIRYIQFAPYMNRTYEAGLEMPTMRDIENGESIDPQIAEEYTAINSLNGYLHDASRLRRCDWEPALEEGNTHLYWLSILGQFRRILIYSGEIHADRAEHDRALREYAAALRIAEHLGQDGTIVSANASAKDARRILSRVEARIDFDRAGEDAIREWIDALDRFDPEDPFGFRAGIETNVEWTVRLIGFEIIQLEETRYNGFTGVKLPDEPIVPKSAADEALVRDLMEGARRWKADMLAAWDLEGAARIDAARRISKAVNAGEYGPNNSKSLFSLAASAKLANETRAAIDEARRSLGNRP